MDKDGSLNDSDLQEAAGAETMMEDSMVQDAYSVEVSQELDEVSAAEELVQDDQLLSEDAPAEEDGDAVLAPVDDLSVEPAVAGSSDDLGEAGGASASAAAATAEAEPEATPDELTEEDVKSIVKIQATYRGHLARKQVATTRNELQQNQDQQETPAQEESAGSAVEQVDEEVAEPAPTGQEQAPASSAAESQPDQPATGATAADAEADMDPEEAAKAALRIQSNFRGHKARKEVASLRQAASAQPLVVVCGPSGVGKGTLITRLMAEYPDRFGFSVSHTTRAPRPGEEDGVHYHFRGREEVEAAVKQGAFLEHAEVHGNMYGTSVAAAQAVSEQGRLCVLDIDVQGAEQVKRSPYGSKALFVFISPPSMEELEQRLRGRGTETEDKIATRLKNARAEMAKADVEGFFDAIVVNDDLDTAYTNFLDVIRTHIPDSVPPASLAPTTAPPAPTPTPNANPTPTPNAEPIELPSPTLTPPTASPSHLSTPASTHKPSALSHTTPPAEDTNSLTTSKSEPPEDPLSHLFKSPSRSWATDNMRGLPVRQYMNETVVPVLREALRALNRGRPDDPLQFVADYVLAERAKLIEQGQY